MDKLVVIPFQNVERFGAELSEDKCVRTRTNSKGVEQSTINIMEVRADLSGGYGDNRRRVAQLTLSPEVMQSLDITEGKDIAPQLAVMFKCPVAIVVTETLDPQWEGHQPKINPETQEEILVNGNNVYRQSKLEKQVWNPAGINTTTWTPTGAFEPSPDILLKETATQATPAMTQNVEFDMSQEG